MKKLGDSNEMDTSKLIHIFVCLCGSPEIISRVYEFLAGQQVSTRYLAFCSQLLVFVNYACAQNFVCGKLLVDC